MAMVCFSAVFDRKPLRTRASSVHRLNKQLQRAGGQTVDRKLATIETSAERRVSEIHKSPNYTPHSSSGLSVAFGRAGREGC